MLEAGRGEEGEDGRQTESEGVDSRRDKRSGGKEAWKRLLIKRQRANGCDSLPEWTPLPVT